MFRFTAFPTATLAGSGLLAMSLFGRKSDVHAEPTLAAAAQRKYKVGILGATGTVGQQFLKKLDGVRGAVVLRSVCH